MDDFTEGFATRAVTYESLRDQCLLTQTQYVDPEFPACAESIFGTTQANEEFEWFRPWEITPDPEFMPSGYENRTIIQGNLGDSGFVAAVTSVLRFPKLIDAIAPSGQSFTSNYAGIFTFRFWRFGEWIDVIIDDQLPTRNGRLVFAHSERTNDYFGALLEKAYAKLHRSYMALSGGLMSEALEDLTGGINERLELTEMQGDASDIFKQLAKKYRMNPLMGCSIPEEHHELTAELQNGLVTGLAYSMTGARQVTLKNRDSAQLIRLRSPWGASKWTGAWSLNASDWQKVNDEERREMQRTDSDSEFWIAIDDFLQEFTLVEVCHLQFGDEALYRPSGEWNVRTEFGRWQLDQNAGGSRNYLDTFATNPQFVLDLTDQMSMAETDVIIGLMQRGTYNSMGEMEYRSIGYLVYELERSSIEEWESGKASMHYVSTHRSVAKVQYLDCREVVGCHRLKKGKYVIIVSTFEPNQEAEFMLRIWS